jgi:hypothetical protein
MNISMSPMGHVKFHFRSVNFFLNPTTSKREFQNENLERNSFFFGKNCEIMNVSNGTP